MPPFEKTIANPQEAPVSARAMLTLCMQNVQYLYKLRSDIMERAVDKFCKGWEPAQVVSFIASDPVMLLILVDHNCEDGVHRPSDDVELAYMEAILSEADRLGVDIDEALPDTPDLEAFDASVHRWTTRELWHVGRLVEAASAMIKLVYQYCNYFDYSTDAFKAKATENMMTAVRMIVKWKEAWSAAMMRAAAPNFYL